MGNENTDDEGWASIIIGIIWIIIAIKVLANVVNMDRVSALMWLVELFYFGSLFLMKETTSLFSTDKQ